MTMLPSVILDASVLVSAFLFPESVPGDVVKRMRDGSIRVHSSSILIEEVRRALASDRLARAYAIEPVVAAAWLKEVKALVTMAPEPLPAIPATCRDPDDDHVLAAAVATAASWIVTGDRDLLALGRYGGVRIVDARTFLTTVRS